MKKARKRNMPAGKIVGEGSYRIVFEINERHVGKKLKKRRVKKYGPITVRYPMKLYSRLKFGVADFNKLEFRNYQKLMKQVPKSLQKNFGEIKRVETRNGKTVLIMKKVKDFNGRLSRNIVETGKIKSKTFWEKIDQIERFFLEKNIPFFGIYDVNILVQWRNEKEAIPVIIDFKRIGSRTYPFQPHLLLKKQARKKVKRMTARLRKRYKP